MWLSLFIMAGPGIITLTLIFLKKMNRIYSAFRLGVILIITGLGVTFFQRL